MLRTMEVSLTYIDPGDLFLSLCRWDDPGHGAEAADCVQEPVLFELRRRAARQPVHPD